MAPRQSKSRRCWRLKPQMAISEYGASQKPPMVGTYLASSAYSTKRIRESQVQLGLLGRRTDASSNIPRGKHYIRKVLIAYLHIPLSHLLTCSITDKPALGMCAPRGFHTKLSRLQMMLPPFATTGLQPHCSQSAVTSAFSSMT
jgi:hypothetical protein